MIYGRWKCAWGENECTFLAKLLFRVAFFELLGRRRLIVFYSPNREREVYCWWHIKLATAWSLSFSLRKVDNEWWNFSSYRTGKYKLNYVFRKWRTWVNDIARSWTYSVWNPDCICMLFECSFKLNSRAASIITKIWNFWPPLLSVGNTFCIIDDYWWIFIVYIQYRWV